MGFISDFKEFAFKGNLIDMAVGLVMGTAVAAMCKSFIDNIVMPLVGSIMKVSFANMKQSLGGEGDNESFLLYGQFIQDVINFVILAFVIFVALKIASKWMKVAADDAPPSDEVVLLTEIRDSLSKR